MVLLLENGSQYITSSINQNIKYAFSNSTSITSNTTLMNNNFNGKNFQLFNQNINAEFSFKKIGRFNLIITFSENLPETILLTQNSQLNSYRSFIMGNSSIVKINSTNYSLNYNKYNDVKRYSINASINYFDRAKNYATSNTINQNFSFSNYFPFQGGDMALSTLGLTNYFRKIKLATKIETNQSYINTPIQINSTEITTLKNFSSEYKFSATTYFNKICNFDFGVNYLFFNSEFESSKSKNSTKDFFINVNYIIKNIWVFELKNNIYYIDGDNYKFVNARLTYNPKENRFSYLLLFNNLFNENSFTTQTISSYSFFKTNINLVPRYIFASLKYRF